MNTTQKIAERTQKILMLFDDHCKVGKEYLKKISLETEESDPEFFLSKQIYFPS
jgi:hypothetical protein